MKSYTTLLFALLISVLTGNITLVAAQGKVKSEKETYQELLAKHFDAEGPGATLLVAKKGKVIFEGSIGKANLELEVPMQPIHVHRLGSITKQFTAVAILMLMEQGKLNLQDPITKFIPDYPTQGKTITVEHLLTHTSGIRSMTDMPGFFDNARKDMTTEEMLNYFKNEPMEFDPGEKWKYNNSGYYLLGVIIEKVSGMTYADFIQKNIFDKVGMNYSHYGDFRKIIPMRASGYQKDDDQYLNAPYLSMTLPYAAGSLLSNVTDLYKWNQALFEYRLVRKETLDKALVPYVLNDGNPTSYGYGWGVGSFFGNAQIAHGGGIHGFLTQAMYLPEPDVFVAVFSNCNCQPPDEIADIAAAMAIGKYTPKKKISLSKEILDEYTGVYAIEGSEATRTIQVSDDHLTSLRSGGQTYDIYPFEKDKFFFDNSLTVFEFRRNAEGKVIELAAIRADEQNDVARLTDRNPVTRKEIKLEPEVLQRYVGKYEMDPGFNLTFTLENGVLMGQPGGDSKLPLYPETETSFFLKDIDAQVEFMKDDKGQFTRVRLQQGEREANGVKKMN